MELSGAGGVRNILSNAFPFYYLGFAGFKSRMYFVGLLGVILFFFCLLSSYGNFVLKILGVYGISLLVSLFVLFLKKTCCDKL